MNDLFVYLSTALQDVNMTDVLTTAGAFLAISLVISWLGKTFFGPDSGLSNAVSSAIGILFIYVATIAVISIGGELEPFKAYLSPLPFVRIENDTLMLFVFENADHATICSQLLSMVILAFLVNLLDSLLPRGKNLIVWFALRCATVVLSILAHWLVTSMFTAMLPDVIVTNAATILLGILVLMLAAGSMKFLVGAAIATVNPIIGALYTFFFANVIGTQLSKSVLTTAILSLLVLGLNYIGVDAISISIAAIMGYLPFLGVMVVVWYVIHAIL